MADAHGEESFEEFTIRYVPRLPDWKLWNEKGLLHSGYDRILIQ